MKFRSRRAVCSVLAAVLLSGCATPSGLPAAKIAEAPIAAAYLPLNGRVHLGLDNAAGAAVMVMPGIAVTNAHNANLVDKARVIGTASQSDLMFFRQTGGAPPPMGTPAVGQSVIAYGQAVDGSLRIAHGVVTQIVMTPGYDASPYFIFAGNAGPGFSGGPVLDTSGRLIGITFAYKDQRGRRQIYAYDMARVRAEFSLLPNAQKR